MSIEARGKWWPMLSYLMSFSVGSCPVRISCCLLVLDFQTVWICCLDVLKLPPGPLGPPVCSGEPFPFSRHQDSSRSAELREEINSKGTGLSLGMSVLVHGSQNYRFFPEDKSEKLCWCFALIGSKRGKITVNFYCQLLRSN